MREAAGTQPELAGLQPYSSDNLLGAVFADGDTAMASRVAQGSALAMRAPGAPVPVRVNVAWFRGLWAAFRADSTSLVRCVTLLDSLAAVEKDPGRSERVRLRADVLRLSMPNVDPDRQALEQADSLLSQGPLLDANSRAEMNVIVARTYERLGDTRRAFRAIERVAPWEILSILNADRDLIRLNLAAGDTAVAIAISQRYLRSRRSAEPPQKAADEAVRKKLDELLRLRR